MIGKTVLRESVGLCLCIAVIILFPLSSAEAKSNAAQKAAIVRDLVTHHVIPRYKNLSAKSADLAQYATRYCRALKQSDMAELKTRYKAALTAWMGIQHIRFGPVMRKDRYYRIQFWPDKHGQGGRQLRKLLKSKNKPAPNLREIAIKSAALQGFPALERILFDPNSNALSENRFLCGLTIAITGNLAAMAKATHDDWRRYDISATNMVMVGLFRALNEQLRTIGELKLKRPLGKSFETARPKRSESWRSHMSRENMIANLEGLRGLFVGEKGRRGLRAALDVDGRGGDAGLAIDEALKFAANFLRLKPAPFVEAVTDKKLRGSYVFLVAHLSGILGFISEDLAPALDIPMGFNSLDGD